MSEYDSWRMLLEDFRLGYIKEQDVRSNLNELSYDMTEDELEEAEEKFEEYILSFGMSDEFYDFEVLDSIPAGEEDDFSWGDNFKDY